MSAKTALIQAGTLIVLIGLSTRPVQATETATRAASAPERVQLLADVVVQGSQQQPAPAPAPATPAPVAPVVVQPQQPVVAAPAPTTRQSTVVEHETHSYMGTIAWSALTGGVLGVLVGGSLYYLVDDRKHAARIGYWAAGGVLVGAGVGIAQVAVQEGRVDRATASRLPSDPAPTLRLALYRTQF